MTVRRMNEADLGEVNRILSQSQAGPIRDPGLPAPKREPQLVASYRDAHEEGAHVAEEDGRIVGFACTRLWGRTGWIGPLAVEQPMQGRGIGSRLLEESINALQGAGVTVLGAEIRADEPRPFGLLAGHGFHPVPPAVVLERSVGEEGVPADAPEAIYFSSLMEAERERFLEDVRRISSSLDADLDYRSEVELVDRHELGDSLLLRDDERALGLAVCHTRPWLEEGEPPTLRVRVLALDENDPFPSLDPLLGVVGVLARESGAERIRLPLPTRAWEGLRIFLERGWRVGPTRVRMTLLGYPERGEASRVHLAAWD